MSNFTWKPDAPLSPGKTGKTTEPAAANDALRDYVITGLSLYRLWQAYREDADDDPAITWAVKRWKSRGAEPPVVRLSTIEGWSVRYDWQERKARYHELRGERDTDAHEAARRYVENIAFADAGELRDILRESMDELRARIKQIATEVGASVDGAPSVLGRVDLSPVKQATDTLDKLDQIMRRALGMPERITQASIQHTGADDGPLEFATVELTDEERAAFAISLLQRAAARAEGVDDA